MGKPLHEMTLEELWQLFPIFLTEHQEGWSEQYNAEEAELRAVLPCQIALHHIGSTAINGIRAKPIVDILAELPADFSMDEIVSTLTANGYILMSSEPERRSLNKGYTENGFADKVFHLHLRYRGDNDELYFRDYMNAHAESAKRYEALKLSLWKRFEHDRDGYTNAKGDFIKACTALAKEEFSGRYSE